MSSPEDTSNAIPPYEIINQERMSFGQWVVVTICIGALALDGFDVLAISLAGVGIAEEWGLSKAQLGFLLPLELLGMALGSIFIGALSDSFGRRPIIIICLGIMSIGMVISGFSPNITTLAASRIFTGLGIGGVLASATAMSSEFCNNKYRSFAVVLVAGGFSLGVFFASKVAGPILTHYDWRFIFYLGALISVLFIPLILFFVPESISFIDRKRPQNAQEKIQKILSKFGHNTPFRLSNQINISSKTTPKQLFNKQNRRMTIILIFSYFMNILTYYYFVKWTPIVVADLGYSKTDGTEVLAIVSISGLFGSIAMAIFSRFFPLRILMIIALFTSAISVALFPYFSTSLESMMMIGACAGFSLFAVIGGSFGLFSEVFPSAILGSGSGLVLGIGRGGAVLGPWCAGLLLASGVLLSTVSPLMACGSFLAALSLFILPKKNRLK